MRFYKFKIFEITVVLTLAFLSALFLGEKIFIHGTLIVHPQVRWNIAAFPTKLRETGSEIFRRLADLSFLPKIGPEKPIIQPTPSQSPPSQRQPTATPPSQKEPTSTVPPHGPSPTPTTAPIVPTLSPTPLPPTLTPYPTATPTTSPSVTLAQFAQCLTSRGMKMYGSPYCGACAQQRNMFGQAFSYITEIDCTQQSQLCSQKGITGYPTWEDRGGRLYPGVQSFPSLSQISGCPAPS